FLLGDPALPGQDAQSNSSKESLPWYNPARYNPLKLFKRGAKSANDQLASDGSFEQRLTSQLRQQGFLAANIELQDACSAFRELADCVAVLRLTRMLQIDFGCLKWDVTGVKPKPVADSCAGPPGGKAMRLDRAVDLLKPDSDSKTEAKNALEKARNDVKDA